MLRAAITSFLLVVAFGLHGQTDTLSNQITDRPTQSASAYLLPKGFWQIESGFSRLSVKRDVFGSDFRSSSTTYNTTQVRFGLSDKVELRFSQDLIGARTEQDGRVIAELDPEFIPTSIGARIHLWDKNDKGLPQTALLVNVGGPVFSDLATGTTVDFRFNMEHDLGGDFALGYNLGGVFSNDFDSFDGLYTLVLSYAATSELALFGELYGTFPGFNESNISADFGILYAVSPNFQIDAFAGFGISRVVPDNLIGAGISIRIPKK